MALRTLFSAVIVATGAVAALLLATREKPPHLSGLYVGGTLLLSVLITVPENWRARYVLSSGSFLDRGAHCADGQRPMASAGRLGRRGSDADEHPARDRAATGLALKRSHAVSEQLATSSVTPALIA